MCGVASSLALYISFIKQLEIINADTEKKLGDWFSHTRTYILAQPSPNRAIKSVRQPIPGKLDRSLSAKPLFYKLSFFFPPVSIFLWKTCASTRQLFDETMTQLGFQFPYVFLQSFVLFDLLNYGLPPFPNFRLQCRTGEKRTYPVYYLSYEQEIEMNPKWHQIFFLIFLWRQLL